jgi:predicted PurR-regulated permease PerM
MIGNKLGGFITVLTKKTGFLLFAFPLLLFIIYLSRGIISFLLISFFLAYAMNPFVEFFQKRGARRDWAILTVYLILFLCGALAVQLLVPRLINDLTQLLQNLPLTFREIQLFGERIIQNFNSWQLPVDLRVIINELLSRGQSILRNLLTQLGQGMINIFSQSVFLVLTPLVAYYISRDYPDIKLKVNCWLSKHLGEHWTRTFLKIDSVCRLYIRGQLLDTLTVGILLGIGLSILGFEAAFLLGLIAGIFNLIPYFGPALGAIPVLVIALLKSPWLAVYVVVLFLLVNQLEVMFLAPRIIGGNLGLHPVTIIYIILVGGKIGGLLGMILAVPLGAIAIILIKSIYEICFGLE